MRYHPRGGWRAANIWLGMVLLVACDSHTSGAHPAGSAVPSASVKRTLTPQKKVSSLRPIPNPSALTPNDPRMVKAQRQAQASLPYFIAQMAAPDKFRNRHFAIEITRSALPSGVAPTPSDSAAPSARPAPAASTIAPSARPAPAASTIAPSAAPSYSLWVTVLGHRDGVFKCRVDKPRAELPTLKAAMPLSVPSDEVMDWRITDDTGKIFGAFGLRATLSLLPADVRAATESMLQPLPQASPAAAGVPAKP